MAWTVQRALIKTYFKTQELTVKERFIEDEDFFVRNLYEAKNEYDIIAPNGLVLIPESGYLMLVKSFTDDTSGSGFNVVLILLLVFYEK